MAAPTIQQKISAAMQRHQAGQLAEAERVYREVLAVDPNTAIALHLIGIIASQVGQVDQAILLIRQAIRFNPLESVFHSNLGKFLNDTKQYEQAAASCREAIRLAPNSPSPYNNLGNALHGLSRYDEAIDAYQKSITRNPNAADVHNNLGLALAANGRLEEAVSAYSRAIKIHPDYVDAYHNLGPALRDLARFEEAIAVERKTLQYKPDHPDAHLNMGLMLLLLGDFEHGWDEYEWRWRCPTLEKPRQFVQPQWDGSPLAGKTLLVHIEQGRGDCIQFVRYIPLLAAQGARIILACDPEMDRLLEGFPGVDKMVPSITPDLVFDVHCPLLSLPLACKTRLNTIPANVPYFFPKPELVGAWQRKVAFPKDKLKVGLVWAGGVKHWDDRHRSITLKHLAPLASSAPNAAFYSLQKGNTAYKPGDAPPGLEIIDIGPDLVDFVDTAAVISQLDLVITVDTAVAHMAGSMGKPVWVMLRRIPDWRWMLDREDTPWYPSMRLFRQKTAGDWATVINRIADELKSMSVRMP